ncbi:MAG: DUF3089 domain-containing protein [Saprospiraceae bacterium]|nr:DUF3089 domain-containing protein [Saprospiraceae bacterium]
MKIYPYALFPALLGLLSCVSVRPKNAFDATKMPPEPDYALLENWAAHPDKSDPADLSPGPEAPDLQQDALVDVLFFHPTTYTGDRRRERDWNVAVSDIPTNVKTDEGTIQYQASLFNGAGRVFAPRYRQAHLHVFYTKKDTASARMALDLAYEDTKAAFEHYLKHWNNGRPFILAGHSQGARHLLFLLRDLVEGKDLERQLVAAYVVGWPVKNDFFRDLKPCQTPEENGCYCSWRTWERRFGRRHAFERDVVCTNPLIWTTTEGEYAGKEMNKGAVIRPFEKIYPQATDAEVYKGVLLADKPKFRGSLFFIRKNFHVGDLNLYYMNVRENAQARVRHFLRH